MTVNTAFFDSLVDKINGIDNPVHLDRLAVHLPATLQAQKDHLAAELTKLAPFLALATLPSPTPTAIVSWLTDLVTAQVAPQIAAYAELTADVAVLPVEIARVVTALENAKSRLGSSVTIPPII